MDTIEDYQHALTAAQNELRSAYEKLKVAQRENMHNICVIERYERIIDHFLDNQ